MQILNKVVLDAVESALRIMGEMRVGQQPKIEDLRTAISECQASRDLLLAEIVKGAVCRDCGKQWGPGVNSIAFHRCDQCQRERNDYYAEKIGMEHRPRVDSLRTEHEHSTYWNRNGEA